MNQHLNSVELSLFLAQFPILSAGPSYPAWLPCSVRAGEIPAQEGGDSWLFLSSAAASIQPTGQNSYQCQVALEASVYLVQFYKPSFYPRPVVHNLAEVLTQSLIYICF